MPHIQKTKSQNEGEPESVNNSDMQRNNTEHHAMCWLDVLALKTELGFAREKIRMLEDALARMWMEEVVMKHGRDGHVRTLREDVKQRWDFYHQKKDDIAASLCKQHGLQSSNQLSWFYVKQESDRQWELEQHDASSCNNKTNTT